RHPLDEREPQPQRAASPLASLHERSEHALGLTLGEAWPAILGAEAQLALLAVVDAQRDEPPAVRARVGQQVGQRATEQGWITRHALDLGLDLELARVFTHALERAHGQRDGIEREPLDAIELQA